MPIINTVLAGGGGDTVTVSPIGAAKNAIVGDKVLLNSSLSSGPYFNPDRTPGNTLTYCIWSDLINKKAYWVINGNSSSSSNKDGVRYDISDPEHVTYEGTFNLPNSPFTTYNYMVQQSDLLGCCAYNDSSYSIQLMIANENGIFDGSLMQSFSSTSSYCYYFSLSRNGRVMTYHDGTNPHVIWLNNNDTGTFTPVELTLTTTPTAPNFGIVSPDGTLIYYRRQMFKVSLPNVDLLNSNSVGPSTSYQIDGGAFTPDNKFLFVIQRGSVYTFELESDGSLPSTVTSTTTLSNTGTCRVYQCFNGYIQTSNGLLAYNEDTGVVTQIWNSGTTSARSSFTPITNDWSVGVDASTGGLFATNGTNAPTQLAFSPMGTQIIEPHAVGGNYVYGNAGVYQLNTTGLSKISSESSVLVDTWYPIKDSVVINNKILYKGVSIVSDVGHGAVNNEEGFVCYNASYPAYRVLSEGQVETWTTSGYTENYLGFFVINGKAFGNVSSAGGISYKGTLDFDNKTITFEETTGHGIVPALRLGGTCRVSKDQTYILFNNNINSIYKYTDETEYFEKINTPNVILENVTGTTHAIYFNENGDLVICAGQSIYTFAWTPGDISTIFLKDVFTNPLPVLLTPVGESDQFYVFNRAVFSKGSSTQKVAEVYNGHNFNGNTLTGVVKKVNSDGTLDVSTVLQSATLTVNAHSASTITIEKV